MVKKSLCNLYLHIYDFLGNIYDKTIGKVVNKIRNYDYILYLEEQYSKVIWEFTGLSYLYDSRFIIDEIHEKQKEHYFSIYKTDVEDIINDYRDGEGTKEDIIKDLEEYFEIDKEFIGERDRVRLRWNNYNGDW